MTACRTCLHPDREAIDRDLVCEVDSVRGLARKWGLSAAGLRNHKFTHVLQPILRRHLETTPGAFEAMTQLAVIALKRALESDEPMASLKACELYFRVLGLGGGQK
jgi:hypothetical protein